MAKWDCGTPSGQGVYTFADGVKCRITFTDGKMNYENRLIFPDDEFRIEYRGEVRDRNIMHGKGSLIVRSGQKFEGDWTEGVSNEHNVSLNGFD